MPDEVKDSLLGQTLGAYLLTEPLGHGGMATVYKAHEAALDREVAVKILPQSLASSDDFIQRFRREAKAVAQLNHPNIVPIYSYGEERNIIYIAMQLVVGGALKREAGQVFAAEEALKLLAPIARALDYAHQRGIIHRDIKPGNILLSSDNWPMLADFGLARTAEAQHLTATGVSMGRPMYMSPEQGKGVSVDQRTDIYSLGIVLFELVTGEAPFHSETPMGTIVKHITEVLPMPSRINPKLSLYVESIILKAAEKNPANRYQSALEMAEAMEAALKILNNPTGIEVKPQPVVSAATKSGEKARVENPFTFGNPIKEPERFIGRQAEIRQIINRLLSSAHESTSVIGERRMGKTSLLYYLSDPVSAEKHGLTPDKFCPIYVDFQGLTDITPTRFWQRVLKKMSRSIGDKTLVPAIEKLSGQENFDLFDLEDLFEATVDRGLTIVLMMDEFEYVTQNPNFKSDFFGGLRALAIHHGIALLPATRRELVDLCHSDELKGSPFFNIFANVVLQPFNQATVTNLLESYTQAGEIHLSAEEKEFVWKLAGGYPIFVQMAGHYLVEGKIQGLTATSLFQFVTRQFEQQGEAHFTYLWSHCSESEKITLFILLSLSLQKASKKNLPNFGNITRMHTRSAQDLLTLGKRGLVTEQDELYALFSPVFGNWVRREVLAGSGEDESQTSADEWIKNSGFENLKAAKGVLPQFKKKYWPILGGMLKEFTVNLVADLALDVMRGMIR